jgi:hypothetical protein
VPGAAAATLIEFVLGIVFFILCFGAQAAREAPAASAPGGSSDEPPGGDSGGGGGAPFPGISTHSFDAHFAEIARLVMALAKTECRRMTWAFKAAVHHAAGERLGLESWHIERELCRQALRPTDHGALDKLCAMR